MSKDADLVYLGKEGKAFGPYSPDEIDEIKAAGKYIEFSWTWDNGAGQWLPINMPPPPPGAVLRKKTTARRGKSVHAEHLHVICHDNQHLVAGIVVNVNESSFTLESETASTLPIFQKNCRVWVNLLDENSGRGENIRAVVIGVGRRGGRWEYMMKWESSPALIKDL